MTPAQTGQFTRIWTRPCSIMCPLSFSPVSFMAPATDSRSLCFISRLNRVHQLQFICVSNQPWPRGRLSLGKRHCTCSRCCRADASCGPNNRTGGFIRHDDRWHEPRHVQSGFISPTAGSYGLERPYSRVQRNGGNGIWIRQLCPRSPERLTNHSEKW
jgi:hypothetical protein